MFYVVDSKSATIVTFYQPVIAKTFYNDIMISISFEKCHKLFKTSLPNQEIVYCGF